MALAINVLPAGQGGRPQVVDTLILNYAQRSSPRGTFVALRGTSVELALKDVTRLRTDDCLLLDDGSLIEIVAQPEKLLEARARDVGALGRLAWLLGDRHIAVEIGARRLRVLHDPATEALLKGEGASIVAIEAPFEPEGGAYERPAASAHAHDHAHHGHDHHHEHDGS
jgi:urease accessory protein